MGFSSYQELGIFFFCRVLEHVDLVLNTIALLGWHLLLPCYRTCGFSFKYNCTWELHNCTWELHNCTWEIHNCNWELHNILLSVCHLGFGLHNIAETWVTLGEYMYASEGGEGRSRFTNKAHIGMASTF